VAGRWMMTKGCCVAWVRVLMVMVALMVVVLAPLPLFVSLAAAACSPERLAALALLAPALGLGERLRKEATTVEVEAEAEGGADDAAGCVRGASTAERRPRQRLRLPSAYVPEGHLMVGVALRDDLRRWERGGDDQTPTINRPGVDGALAGRLGRLPTLCVHGDEDDVVPAQRVQSFFARLPLPDRSKVLLRQLSTRHAAAVGWQAGVPAGGGGSGGAGAGPEAATVVTVGAEGEGDHGRAPAGVAAGGGGGGGGGQLKVLLRVGGREGGDHRLQRAIRPIVEAIEVFLAMTTRPQPP
jgi:hypothetical protein